MLLDRGRHIFFISYNFCFFKLGFLSLKKAAGYNCGDLFLLGTKEIEDVVYINRYL